MGEKDDLINMPPKKKLMIEIAAASLLAIGTDLRISSLHGILGIDLLPVWVSIILTVFVIIFVMNAFNLIDGIDGLAAGIGIFASVLYGICFWLAGDTGYAVMCAAIAGALCAFLPYNFDKGKLKIFMGDTGSLTVGFLLAIITIRFNENSVNNIAAYNFISTPAISLSILILPLYDTVRVFVIRIIQKKNPFKGDNNHLHHRLIRFGYTHMQATIIFLAFSSLLVILALSINHLGTNLVSVVVIFFSAVLSYGSFRLENRMLYRKQKNYPVLNNLSYKKTG
jgi:UDP-N-acetylmuramyl pentapeptide phosphotransferase/UDP-N-acetylglucosamine-1-phosphate transferase